MNKSTHQNKDSLFARWLHVVFFNFILSIIPLALLLLAYYVAHYRILKHEVVPDLIMVAFAVCVNIYNMASEREKANRVEKAASGFSVLAFIICSGIYFYTVGIVAELGEQIEKFTNGYDESPEIAVEYAKGLASYFKNRLDTFRWDILFFGAIAVLLICMVFGTVMVFLSFRLEKENAETLPGELHTLIKDMREKLSDKDYDEFIREIKEFQQETRVKMEKMVLVEMKEDNYAKGEGGESGE